MNTCWGLLEQWSLQFKIIVNRAKNANGVFQQIKQNKRADQILATVVGSTFDSNSFLWNHPLWWHYENCSACYVTNNIVVHVLHPAAVVPTGIFLCQIFEIWHFLELVGINIFSLAYLLNLAYFWATNYFWHIQNVELNYFRNFQHFCEWKHSWNSSSWKWRLGEVTASFTLASVLCIVFIKNRVSEDV